MSIGKRPSVVTSVSGTSAVICDEDTNVTASGTALNDAEIPLTKLDPLIVRVNVALPGVTWVGDNVVTVGDGLLTVRFLGTPANVGAGFVTNTDTVVGPPSGVNAAGIVA